MKEYKRDVDYIFGDEHDDRTMKKMHMGHENDINDLRIVVLGIMSGYWVYDIISHTEWKHRFFIQKTW